MSKHCNSLERTIKLSENTAASTEASGSGTAAISPAVTQSLRETRSKECTIPFSKAVWAIA